jgi:hypothetical protein
MSTAVPSALPSWLRSVLNLSSLNITLVGSSLTYGYLTAHWAFARVSISLAILAAWIEFGFVFTERCLDWRISMRAKCHVLKHPPPFPLKESTKRR